MFLARDTDKETLTVNALLVKKSIKIKRFFHNIVVLFRELLLCTAR